MMPDHVRILGQITRGEIRTGAAAAREIAARHQAAYGQVWDTITSRCPDCRKDFENCTCGGTA